MLVALDSLRTEISTILATSDRGSMGHKCGYLVSAVQKWFRNSLPVVLCVFILSRGLESCTSPASYYWRALRFRSGYKLGYSSGFWQLYFQAFIGSYYLLYVEPWRAKNNWIVQRKRIDADTVRRSIWGSVKAKLNSWPSLKDSTLNKRLCEIWQLPPRILTGKNTKIRMELKGKSVPAVFMWELKIRLPDDDAMRKQLEITNYCYFFGNSQLLIVTPTASYN